MQLLPSLLYQEGKKGQHSQSTECASQVSLPRLSVQRQATPKGNIRKACWDEPTKMSQIIQLAKLDSSNESVVALLMASEDVYSSN